MFNTSIIIYVIHWVILIYLCRKPLYILLLFTAGICFTNIGFNTTNKNYEHSFGGWNWFGYVKAISLVIGYIGYCFLYITRDSKKLNKIARIFLQWILAINVFEAGIYACQYYEFVIGILLIIISPFSPGFYINDEKTIYSKKSNIIQQEKHNFFSIKWYFRFYLIVLGVFHATGYDFSVYHINIYATLTCLFSFLLNEYYLNNYANHFNIRVFALFIGTFIDASYDLKWYNKQPNMIVNVNVIVRNQIQAVIIAFLFALCVVNDKLRSKSDVKMDENQFEPKETSSKIINENNEEKKENVLINDATQMVKNYTQSINLSRSKRDLIVDDSDSEDDNNKKEIGNKYSNTNTDNDLSEINNKFDGVLVTPGLQSNESTAL